MQTPRARTARKTRSARTIRRLAPRGEKTVVEKLVDDNLALEKLGELVFPSELGWIGCLWRGERLAAMTFGHQEAETARRSLTAVLAAGGRVQIESADEGDPAVVAVRDRLQRFAAGDSDDFLDVALDLRDTTTFQRRVLELCREIGAGRVRTYAELAALAGSPGAARAVGNIMAKNRFPLIVPCHRVVGSGGSLGGYSAPQGLTMKRRLLEREGALRKAST